MTAVAVAETAMAVSRVVGAVAVDAVGIRNRTLVAGVRSAVAGGFAADEAKIDGFVAVVVADGIARVEQEDGD